MQQALEDGPARVRVAPLPVLCFNRVSYCGRSKCTQPRQLVRQASQHGRVRRGHAAGPHMLLLACGAYGAGQGKRGEPGPQLGGVAICPLSLLSATTCPRHCQSKLSASTHPRLPANAPQCSSPAPAEPAAGPGARWTPLRRPLCAAVPWTACSSWSLRLEACTTVSSNIGKGSAAAVCQASAQRSALAAPQHAPTILQPLDQGCGSRHCCFPTCTTRCRLARVRPAGLYLTCGGPAARAGHCGRSGGGMDTRCHCTVLPCSLAAQF